LLTVTRDGILSAWDTPALAGPPAGKEADGTP
jgi:hypothetical protein